MQSKLKDNGRMWLWGFLAVLGLSQLYVVRELLVAFAFFALTFAAMASIVASIYLLHHGWEMAASLLTNVRRPLMQLPAVSREQQKVA